MNRFKAYVTRRNRAKPIHWELFRGERNCFLNFGIASRTVHRWWAFTVWVEWAR